MPRQVLIQGLTCACGLQKQKGTVTSARLAIPLGLSESLAAAASPPFRAEAAEGCFPSTSIFYLRVYPNVKKYSQVDKNYRILLPGSCEGGHEDDVRGSL